MFMQRFITSLILIPIILLLIFYAQPWVLGGLLILVLLCLAKECWQLIPIKNPFMMLAFDVLLLLGVWASFYLFPYCLLIGLLLWGGICIAIVTYPLSQAYWGKQAIVFSVLLIILPLFIQALSHIYGRDQGKILLVYLFFLVWAADIGAYIVGKAFGHTPLIPMVSPKKSWEGVLGGLVLALLIAWGAFLYFSPGIGLSWFLWAVLTVGMSMMGDLFISILKRRCHLKDTGSIIVGHGGILDRLDSMIAAAPVFYLGLTQTHAGILIA